MAICALNLECLQTEGAVHLRGARSHGTRGQKIKSKKACTLSYLTRVVVRRVNVGVVLGRREEGVALQNRRRAQVLHF
jgi:hypothetical protein